MKEKIPFTKEIDLKEKISNITSISLEHQENIKVGEISGDFIIFGDYKLHNDTTEKELFKYRLPFTAIIPSEIDEESIKLDIDDFTYDIIDDHIMKVNIDYTIEGEVKEINPTREDPIDILKEIEEEPAMIIDQEPEPEENPIIIEPPIEERKEEPEPEETTETKEQPNNSEFITYNVHIVKENETIDNILTMYNTNIDNLKIYNDVTNINIGDKIIIPANNE